MDTRQIAICRPLRGTRSTRTSPTRVGRVPSPLRLRRGRAERYAYPGRREVGSAVLSSSASMTCSSLLISRRSLSTSRACLSQPAAQMPNTRRIRPFQMIIDSPLNTSASAPSPINRMITMQKEKTVRSVLRCCRCIPPPLLIVNCTSGGACGFVLRRCVEAANVGGSKHPILAFDN